MQDKRIPLYIAVIASEDTESKMNSLLPKPKDFNDEFHITVLFSRKPAIITEKIESNLNTTKKMTKPIVATVVGWKIFESEQYGKSFVLVTDCKVCELLHKKFMEELDASFDYPKYIPHVTLYYNLPKGVTPEELYQKFEGMKLVFDKMRFEPFNDTKYQED